MTKSPEYVDSSAKQATCIVIAAYNESEKIASVIHRLLEEFPNIVVVDDGSSDRTEKLAEQAGATVLRHIFNRGQGAALKTGLDYAMSQGAEYLITFDGDGQHRVEDIPKLLGPLTRGECDLTLGSRFLGDSRSVPLIRRTLLRTAVVFTRLSTGITLTDCHNGLRAFNRRAMSRINMTMDGMAHASEILDQIAASGLKFREVPVTINYTSYSLGKGQRSLDAFPVAADYLFNKFLK